MAPELSIVILTCDSLGIVERLVDALLAQRGAPSYEVLFMDNASRDGTVEYLDSVPIPAKRIVNVPKGSFSHSRTRMQAAELATGRVMVFFVDDIVPIGSSFLAELTRPVLSGRAPAAYGVFQVDAATCDPIDARLHNDWWRSFPELTGPVSEFAWEYIRPDLRRRFSNFDNCASAIERELLLEVRFPDVPYGEDMTLAKRLLRAGHSIALAKQAKFYHWHRSSFSYTLKRMCIDADLTRREFDHVLVKRKLGVARAVAVRALHRLGIALFELDIPLRRKLYWFGYNVKILTADFVGKYIGNLEPGRVGRLAPLDRRLLRLKQEILAEIEAKSVKRY